MAVSVTTAMMPTGENRRESPVSTDARAAGTSLRTRSRLTSQLTAPVLRKSAETANSTAPRAAKSPAVPALGTRTGRFGHHHDSREIMGTRQLGVRTVGPAPPAGRATDQRGCRG